MSEVILTINELEELLAAKDELSALKESLLTSGSIPILGSYVVGCLDPDEAPIIERPTWAAFLYLCIMENPDPELHIESAFHIGTKTAALIRMSKDEVDYLNTKIYAHFGTSGISIQLHQQDTPVSDYEPLTSTITGCYQPVPYLSVSVVETTHRGGSPFERSTLEMKYEWAQLSAITCMEQQMEMYLSARIQDSSTLDIRSTSITETAIDTPEPLAIRRSRPKKRSESGSPSQFVRKASKRDEGSILLDLMGMRI